jgi:hypothetical protein
VGTPAHREAVNRTRPSADTGCMPAASARRRAAHARLPAAQARLRAAQLPVIAIGVALLALEMWLVVYHLPIAARLDDFRREAWPAYRALLAGHPLLFLRRSPAYVGSLVLRAPFALLAGAIGGGWRLCSLITGLPCLVAVPVLGGWLAVRSPGRSPEGSPRGRLRRVSPLVLCALNPIFLVAIIGGHPEDVLGASMCIAALLLAREGKSTATGVLLGLAVINQEWALVAVPVVIAVMPSGARRALVLTGGLSAAVYAPVLLARLSAAHSAGAAASLGGGTGRLFLSPQLLFWLGRGSVVVQHAHELIPIAGLAVALAWRLRRARGADCGPPGPQQALMLLALVLLLRAALDPWDNLYYHLPFVMAVMASEAGRAPKRTVLVTVALCVVVPVSLLPLSAAWHAAAYAMLIVPLLAWLTARAFELPLPLARRPQAAAVLGAT